MDMRSGLAKAARAAKFWNWGAGGQVVAVDIGSANTAMWIGSKKNPGKIHTEPTMVRIKTATNEILAYGHDAKRAREITPKGVKTVLLVTNGRIKYPGLVQKFLEEMARRCAAASKTTLRPDGLVLLTIHTDPDESTEQILAECARKALLANKVFIGDQATLSAIGAGYAIIDTEDPEKAKVSMVVDIGEGTTDMAVISFGGHVENGYRSVSYGGQTITRDIIEEVKRRHKVILGIPTAERLKEKFATAYMFNGYNAKAPVAAAEEQIAMDTEALQALTPGGKTAAEFKLYMDDGEEVRGRSMVKGGPTKCFVTRRLISQAANRTVTKITNEVRGLLAGVHEEVYTTLHDKGIVICGGGAGLEGWTDRFAHDVHDLTAIPAFANEKVVILGAIEAIQNQSLFSLVAEQYEFTT